MSNLIKSTIRLGVAYYICENSDETLETYFGEGEHYAPILMSCSTCNEIFYYPQDYGVFSEKIKDKQCPTCNSVLEETLVNYKAKSVLKGKNWKKIKTERGISREFIIFIQRN